LGELLKKKDSFISSIIKQIIESSIFAFLFKAISTILLLLAFAAQTFRGGVVVLDYYTNKAAFEKKCVNKAKPKMHCNGKCQMMKKLQEEERKDQQVPERKFENKMEVLYCISVFSNSATLFSVIAPKTIVIVQNCLIKDISYAFFHPPQA
jgi:hypothetical protein